jgi:hypothetical protein
VVSLTTPKILRKEPVPGTGEKPAAFSFPSLYTRYGDASILQQLACPGEQHSFCFCGHGTAPPPFCPCAESTFAIKTKETAIFCNFFTDPSSSKNAHFVIEAMEEKSKNS